MKEIYYIYNNEAIASCVLLHVLREVKIIDVAASCLILPFLLDDRTVALILSHKDKDISLEKMIETNPRLFTSFNKRYLALLPVTINSLMILSKSDQIDINSNISIKTTLLTEISNIGNRFNLIKSAVPTLIKILKKNETTNLYKLLNVQL